MNNVLWQHMKKVPNWAVGSNDSFMITPIFIPLFLHPSIEMAVKGEGKL